MPMLPNSIEPTFVGFDMTTFCQGANHEDATRQQQELQTKDPIVIHRSARI